MKKSIITLMLIVGLTNHIQASSILEPILRFLVQGTVKLTTMSTDDKLNENNQTKEKKKK